MTHSFKINFDPLADRLKPERTLKLDIVMTPVDAFDQTIVHGVKANIEKLGKRAGVSLSGHLVFERLPEQFDEHLVTFDMDGTGYFPEPPRLIALPQVRVKPAELFPVPDDPADPDPLAVALARDTRLLRLIRRPEAVIDGTAMIVRGGVVRDGKPAEGVDVTGSVFEDDPPAKDEFSTRTNEKGNFAIRLRLPPPALDADAVEVPQRAHVRLRFDDAHEWRSDQDIMPQGEDHRLTDMTSYIIRDPIDIT
jgi:hypothetical protein